MKAERVQFRYSFLNGWVLVNGPDDQKRFGGKEEKQPFIWTAFELADQLEACELVTQIGGIADRLCVFPELDVRRNYVFVTVGNERDGITEEEFDFAEELDREIGPGQRVRALVSRVH